MTGESEALKPCPFCGGAPQVLYGMAEYWVLCRCEAYSGSSNQRNKAITAWNRRVSDPAQVDEGGDDGSVYLIHSEPEYSNVLAGLQEQIATARTQIEQQAAEIERLKDERHRVAAEDHDWRLPVAGEPMEEGAVCKKCGAYASEANKPCQPDDVGDPTEAERAEAIACVMARYGQQLALAYVGGTAIPPAFYVDILAAIDAQIEQQGDPADAWDAGYHAGENAAQEAISQKLMCGEVPAAWEYAAALNQQAAEIERLKSIIKSNEDGEKTVKVTQACLGALLDHPCRACEEGYRDTIQARDAALVQARQALAGIVREADRKTDAFYKAHSAIAAINALEEAKP